MTPRVGVVGLIGTGMVGSSLLLGLRQQGWYERAVGFDIDAANLDVAVKSGVIDTGMQSIEDVGATADVVILAVPVLSTDATCRALAASLGQRPEVTVTDVGSVKSEVIRGVEEHLPIPERFVPGHPIAGTEQSGPAAALAKLFFAKRVVLTPGPQTNPQSIELCRDMWLAVGAQVHMMSPDLHDRIFSLVSHLPHVSAFALAAAVAAVCEQEPDLAGAVPGFFGGGFVDTTRIAASSPSMWRDVLLANRGAVRSHLSALQSALQQLAAALDQESGDELVRIIAKAHNGRRQVLAEDKSG